MGIIEMKGSRDSNMKRTQVLPLVQADLEARIAKGAAQYGERLTTHNGRDALWDAYEEALDEEALVDLAVYLRQAIEERGGKPKQDTRLTLCGWNDNKEWMWRIVEVRPGVFSSTVWYDHEPNKKRRDIMARREFLTLHDAFGWVSDLTAPENKGRV